MITVDADEAKTRLFALLEQVRTGGEVTITQQGRPVARLIGLETPERGAVDAAIAGLKALREGASLGGLDERTLRREGRR